MILTRCNGICVRLCYLTILSAILTGCLKENKECVEILSFTVKAYANDGTELTRAEVSPVYLYYFDSRGYYFGGQVTELNETVQVAGLPEDEVHVVAWGNLNGSTETNLGEHESEFGVGLRSITRSASSWVTPPDNYFLGDLKSPTVGLIHAEPSSLSIFPKVGSMKVKIMGLREFYEDDDDYSIGVLETGTVIGFDGVVYGEKAGYRPIGGFDTDSEDTYVVPLFYILPEPDGVSVDIFHGEEVIARVSLNHEEQPIRIEQGELTELVIRIVGPGNFGGLHVEVKEPDWEPADKDKEF